MKKKLQLNDLKVQSFVTTDIKAEEIKGGSLETKYSCLKFITCDLVGCALSQGGANCPTGTIG